MKLTGIIFSAIYLVINVHCQLLEQPIVELQHTNKFNESKNNLHLRHHVTNSAAVTETKFFTVF